MMTVRPLRCGYCGLSVERSSGVPPAPNEYVVCFGCSGLGRFSSDARRIEVVEEAEFILLDRALQLELAGLQQGVRDHWKDRGLPEGFEWQRSAVCTGCWEHYWPGRPAFSLSPSEWELCGLCAQPTDSGIYRRLIVKCRQLAAEAAS